MSTNRYGLLEPGIHPMSLDEIEQLFGRFQGSDRRSELMKRLRNFVKAVGDVDDRIQVYVDGSFIMSKIDEPGDIDIGLVLPAGWDSAAELRPFEYNVVSKRMVRRLHRFDMLVGVDGEESAAKVIDFFCQVNPKWHGPLAIPTGVTKGLVRIAL